MDVADVLHPERLGALGVLPGLREEDQLGQLGVGEACANGLLLPDDDLCGGVRDRQAEADAVVLEVGVDEHGFAVLVGLHAVPGEASDLVGASAGIDKDLNGGARVVAAVPDLVEGGQPLAELAEDLLRQGSARPLLDDDRGMSCLRSAKSSGRSARISPGRVRPRSRISRRNRLVKRQTVVRRKALISPVCAR
ncbi:hypothetical protein NKH77_48715 [Streptomyces sp. M19]